VKAKTRQQSANDCGRGQDALETAALLTRDLAQLRLAFLVKWLALDLDWSSSGVWERVLDAAILVGGADCANVQLVHRRLRGLELTAQRGFQRPFLEFFRFVNDAHSACGMALKQRCPIMVDDVCNSPIFANTPQLELLLDAGVRAVKSVPLVGGTGRTLGMLSVHYRQPRRERNGESACLKVLARAIGRAVARHPPLSIAAQSA
jgi:signal transduction protein with GAF and PtsI domain